MKNGLPIFTSTQTSAPAGKRGGVSNGEPFITSRVGRSGGKPKGIRSDDVNEGVAWKMGALTGLTSLSGDNGDSLHDKRHAWVLSSEALLVMAAFCGYDSSGRRPRKATRSPLVPCQTSPQQNGNRLQRK